MSGEKAGKVTCREEIRELGEKIGQVSEMMENLREYMEYYNIVDEMDMRTMLGGKPKSATLDELKKIKEINVLVKDIPSKLQKAEELMDEVEHKAVIEKFRQELSN